MDPDFICLPPAAVEIPRSPPAQRLRAKGLKSLSGRKSFI